MGFLVVALLRLPAPKRLEPVGLGSALADSNLIVDGRSAMGWGQRLPARLGTSALWGFTLLLLLPGLPWVVAGTGVALPLVLQLLAKAPRQLRQADPGLLAPPQPLAPSQDPERRELAEAFGISEATLFRARHAQICTVHHDDNGVIVAFSLPCHNAPSAVVERHAHPVS